MATDFDVFISHASEDKDEVARPLAAELKRRGLRVWLDERSISLGDSLRRSIDQGISHSRFGIVILSPDSLRKEWPQKELDAFFAREDGTDKVVLPVWHNVSRADIIAYSPLLADKFAVPTSRGLKYVAEQVVHVVLAEGKPAHAHSQSLEEQPENEPTKSSTIEIAGESDTARARDSSTVRRLVAVTSLVLVVALVVLSASIFVVGSNNTIVKADKTTNSTVGTGAGTAIKPTP